MSYLKNKGNFYDTHFHCYYVGIESVATTDFLSGSVLEEVLLWRGDLEVECYLAFQMKDESPSPKAKHASACVLLKSKLIITSACFAG